MGFPIDPATSNVIHRQSVPYSAALVGGDEPSGKARPWNGARRVEPVEDSGAGAVVDDGSLRQWRHEEGPERLSSEPEADADVRPELAESSYERKLSYEADVNRVYVEIVSKEDEEVLMRIPSDSTARYLERIAVRSDEKDQASLASMVHEIV